MPDVRPESGLTLDAFKDTAPCQHCGGYHAIACPRIRSLRFMPSGTVERVEFWPEWDESRVIYPEDLPVPEEDTDD